MVVSQEDVKKEYITPKLIVHGTISEMTKATGGTPTYEDGVFDHETNTFLGNGEWGSSAN